MLNLGDLIIFFNSRRRRCSFLDSQLFDWFHGRTVAFNVVAHVSAVAFAAWTMTLMMIASEKTRLLLSLVIQNVRFDIFHFHKEYFYGICLIPTFSEKNLLLLPILKQIVLSSMFVVFLINMDLFSILRRVRDLFIFFAGVAERSLVIKGVFLDFYIISRLWCIKIRWSRVTEGLN